MPEEDFQQVSLVNREQLEIIGVQEVVDYNEGTINLDTNRGLMKITGEQLHIKHLDLEELKLEVTGSIKGLEYKSASQVTGLFKRLFK